MVRFEDLKTGDTIARRVVIEKDGKLIHSHSEAYTVRAAVGNASSGSRSVWVGTGPDDVRGYWLHDLQFSTIQDELDRWDKL